jgi:hypothetical protein
LVSGEFHRTGDDHLQRTIGGFVERRSGIGAEETRRSIAFPSLLSGRSIERHEVRILRRVDQQNDIALRVDRRNGDALHDAEGTERRAPQFFSGEIVGEQTELGEEDEDRLSVGGGAGRGGPVEGIRRLVA